jgi:hypothetical protein
MLDREFRSLLSSKHDRFLALGGPVSSPYGPYMAQRGLGQYPDMPWCLLGRISFVIMKPLAMAYRFVTQCFSEFIPSEDNIFFTRKKQIRESNL